MDKNIIEELLSKDYEEVYEFFGIDIEDEKSNEKIFEEFAKLGKNIKESDYEYIKEKFRQVKGIEVATSILIELVYNSSIKTEDKLELIEKRKEYALNSSDVASLIKTVNDLEYTKQCIINKEKYGLTLNHQLELIGEDIKFKYIYVKENKDYGFIDLEPENMEGIELIDIQRIEKIFEDFEMRDNREGFKLQVKTISNLKEELEIIEKNNYKFPYVYIEELNKNMKVKSFLNDNDFRFFKSEFPKINKMLEKHSEEEKLDFYKFATVLGCFSTEKMKDKSGRDTDVLLAQKAKRKYI